MRYYIMPSNDIRINLATEEYLMDHIDVTEPLFLLYIQKPCVILGRNQNAYEEVNLPYLREKKMTLTRRISGGGTVYDDLGNISFSFVTKKGDMTFGDYRGVTTPILTALHQMGAVNAVAGGRNDLYIDEKKFSGNAMYSKNERTYSHGTLMYDVDQSVLDELLTVAKEKIASKATQSVKKNVTNVRPYLSPQFQQMTTEEFRDELLCRIYGVTSLADIQAKELQLTEADQRAIHQLVDDKYANDAWIYGETPMFDLQRRMRKPGVGIVDVKLSMTAGMISELSIAGDFFGVEPVEILVNQLIGKPFIYDEIKELLSSIDVSQYILNYSSAELLALLFD